MNDSTSDTIKVDTARLLRCCCVNCGCRRSPPCGRASPSGPIAKVGRRARLLATLTELELAERDQRRIQRHLLEARLPPGKTLDNFDFTAVPMLSRAHVAALATGDGWIDRGGTILFVSARAGRENRISAPPSATRSSRTATGSCSPEPPISCSACNKLGKLCRWRAPIEKLDKYHVLILEDLCYVRKDQAETSVLFELIAALGTNGRSLIVTANHPFGEWTSVFPDSKTS